MPSQFCGFGGVAFYFFYFSKTQFYEFGDLFKMVFLYKMAINEQLSILPHQMFVISRKSKLQKLDSSKTEHHFNPLTPNIKEQILLSYPYTFLIKILGRNY